MDAKDHKEAIKQLQGFIDFMLSDEQKDFEDCDPTSGIFYSREWVVARNYMRCFNMATEMKDAAGDEPHDAFLDYTEAGRPGYLKLKNMPDQDDSWVRSMCRHLFALDSQGPVRDINLSLELLNQCYDFLAYLRTAGDESRIALRALKLLTVILDAAVLPIFWNHVNSEPSVFFTLFLLLADPVYFRATSLEDTPASLTLISADSTVSGTVLCVVVSADVPELSEPSAETVEELTAMVLCSRNVIL